MTRLTTSSKYFKRILFFVTWMTTALIVHGQEALEGSEQGESTVINDTIQYSNYLERPMSDIITDTTLNGNFHTTGYIEDRWPRLMTLGYSGSPVYGPHYYVPQGAGWDLGFHSFDPYRKDFENLLFIREGLPITKVTYVQTPQVNQSIFNGYFARKLNDVSFALDHNRFNFNGDYQNQRSFNTIFHTGLTVNKTNWYAYFLFASEVFEQDNNGGITNTSYYGNTFYDNRAGFPVQFKNGASRDDSKKARIGYMLKALKFRKYGINIGLQTDALQRQLSVTSESPDSTSYFPLYNEISNQGLNSYMKHKSLLPGAVLEFSDSSNATFNVRSLTGIHLNQLEFIDGHTSWQEFVQQGQLTFRSSFIEVQSDLDLRIFNDNVFFDLQGKVDTYWRGFGVSGMAAIKRTAAPWLYRKQSFSGQNLWNNEPPALFTQLLGGAIGYDTDFMTARLTLKQIFQSNIPYLNNQGRPDTLADQTMISLVPVLNAKWGLFHTENQLTLFLSENTHPFYPTLSGNHNLFIEDKWFKDRMHINLGLSLYWKNMHNGYYYLPYVQSFLPSEEKLAAEYRVSPFFAFRVKTFKFFVRMENVNLFWQEGKALYDTFHYPLMDPALRLGIEWIFRD